MHYSGYWQEFQPSSLLRTKRFFSPRRHGDTETGQKKCWNIIHRCSSVFIGCSSHYPSPAPPSSNCRTSSREETVRRAAVIERRRSSSVIWRTVLINGVLSVPNLMSSASSMPSCKPLMCPTWDNQAETTTNTTNTTNVALSCFIVAQAGLW